MGMEKYRPHLARLKKWRGVITQAATDYGLEPSLVAAICSRETSALKRYCLPPPIGELGDHGFGHGPMQIDRRSYPDWCRKWAAGELSIEAGFVQGCVVLCEKIKQADHYQVDPYELFQIAVAAYNCGINRAMRGLREGDCDRYTTGHNYSADVLRRAEFFESEGW